MLYLLFIEYKTVTQRHSFKTRFSQYKEIMNNPKVSLMSIGDNLPRVITYYVIRSKYTFRSSPSDHLLCDTPFSKHTFRSSPSDHLLCDTPFSKHTFRSSPSDHLLCDTPFSKHTFRSSRVITYYVIRRSQNTRSDLPE